MNALLRYLLVFITVLVIADLFALQPLADMDKATFFASPAQTSLPQESETLLEETPEVTETAPDIKTTLSDNDSFVETNKTTVQENSPAISTTTSSQKEPTNFEKINESTREALVNILCLTRGGSLSPITGSGIFISEKGVILTNAHIGQYFLLDDYVECFIRTGSPAVPKYKASLLYISKRWLHDNAKNIVTENPKGTGENDYALLLVTQTADKSPLPATFPYVSMELSKDPVTNDEVLIAGYAAGFLGGLVIEHNLSALSSINTIEDVFTFKEATVDLVAVNGSAVSQKGASGGAVVNQTGELTGMVVTATQEAQTGQRQLRAITAGHVNRSFSEETGTPLLSYLSQDLQSQIAVFSKTDQPSLQLILLNEIVGDNK